MNLNNRTQRSMAWNLVRVSGMLVLLFLAAYASASCGRQTPTVATRLAATSAPTPVPTATMPGLPAVDPGAPLPPQVVSQEPAPGQELPLDGSLELKFDQAMDKAATGAALQVLDWDGEPVAGNVTWIDERTVRFTALEPLATGQTYVASLSGEAKSAEGLVVEQPFHWEFSTVGTLAVQQVFPADGAADVANNAVITVIFNRPVVPLVIAEAQADLPDPLQITPALAGDGEWVNTSVYAFHPEGVLKGDTSYTVEIAAGLEDMSGEAILEEDVSWSFTTTAPDLALYWLVGKEWETNPVDGYANVLLDQAFAISFYQPMDPASTESATSIVSSNGEPAPLEFTWNEDFTTVVLTPTQRLSYETGYMLSVGIDAKSADGGSLRSGLDWNFYTISLPGVAYTTPADGDRQAYYTGEFYIRFASPMDLNSLKDKVVFEPALEPGSGWWYGDAYYDDWSWGYYLYGMQPSTTYEVRILPGMKDVYGAEIRTETVLSFTTAAYEPSAYLQLPGGTVLYRSGGPQEFYASYRNIRTLDLELYQLSVDTFLKMDTGVINRWDFDPSSYDLVWSKRVTSTAALNERALSSFTMTGSDGGALSPGIYFLGIRTPEVPRYSSLYNDSRVLIVADANITLKTTTEEALMWVTGLEDGAPIAGVPLTLFDENLAPIGRGVTDEYGLLYIEDIVFSSAQAEDFYTYHTIYVATGEESPAFGLAASNWDSDVSLYDYGIWNDYYGVNQNFVSYIYTERPIYRPGQPVYFKGVLRADDDLDYSLPDGKEVRVLIEGYEGAVYEEKLPLSEFGTFDGVLLLDTAAALGAYNAYVYFPADGSLISSVSFNVAEYRKPEFQVNVDAAPPNLLPGESFAAAIQATYYSGGAVADADVHWVLLADDYYFVPPPELSSYDFTYRESDYGYYYYDYYGAPGSEVIAEGDGRIGADGKLVVELPADLSQDGNARKLTFEATVTDLAGTSVSGRDELVVHRSAVYLGARPQRYVGTAGEEQTFELAAVDWDGVLRPGQEASVEIVERRWYSVQSQDAQGRIVWETSVEEIPVAAFEQVVMDENGKAAVNFTPPNGGVYRLKVTALDADGNEGRASTYMWVAGEEYVPWRQGNDHGFELITDKTAYMAGDTAEVLIASPFQGQAYALVTVERGHVRSHEVILLTSNSMIYELPITPDMAPNVYLFITIIKGVDETSPRPDFRVGLAEIKVDASNQALTVEVTPDREQAGPGDEVTYTVRTSDGSGKPVRAEVSLSLSDLATLSLSPANSVPILDAFYDRRGLQVWTSMPLVYNVEYYNMELADRAEESMPAGSGGGKGSDEYGVIEVRQDFPDTAYWEAHLVTGEDGQATVTVTLPDNLTTWRMDARAVTVDTLVGQASVDLVSTKPLLVRPQTPRFFVVGDEVLLGAAVHNNTAKDLNVDVTLNGDGISLEGKADQTIEVAAGQQAYVTWNVTVLEDVERVDLVFSASAGQYNDASRPTLGTLDDQGIPVYRYEAPETVGTSGQMLEGGTLVEAIVLPDEFTISQGELVIRISPSLAAGMTDGLKYLEDYPYECVEQTISRFLPNILTLRALQEAGIDDPQLEADLNERVSTTLQRLYNWQNPDGGWGWWSNQESNTLTTAYVVLGLAEAQEAGYPISGVVLGDALGFLEDNIKPLTRLAPPFELNRQAFLLYVLTRSGQPDLSTAGKLYEQRQAMDLYARALLAEVFYDSEAEDTRVATLLSDLNSAAVLSATGAHWEEDEDDYWNWNTDTRTTAIVLSTLSRMDAQNPINANAVRWLMSNRTDGHWWSTQETAWTLMALTRWMVASGELQADYEYGVALNGEQLGGGLANADSLRSTQEMRIAITDLLADEANRLAIARSDGTGNLYYTAHLKVYLPVEELEPLERGVIVARSYYPVDDTSTPVTQAAQGDLLLVRLTIVAPHDLHYVVIHDPLPAGLEAVDQSLLTSPQGVQPETYQWEDLVYRGWGWWYFNHAEFRDEGLVLSATDLPAGTYVYTYLARASTVGTFRVIPTTAQEFYFPEVYGRAAGSLFEVKP
ncbi:MAG TPA: Ig-like domain-containing protein [Anaerolineales bacterium]|nr:Ig-like domain-containing protein [Anaerolineales bacterium]